MTYNLCLKKFCKILKRALLSHKVCIITFQHQRTAWTNVRLQSYTSLISNLVLLVLILPWLSTPSLHYRLIYYNLLNNNTFSCLLHVFWADVFEYTWFILKDSINLVILNSFHSLLPVVNLKLLLLLSSVSPLCRVSTLIFLRQSMSLGNTVLQLFWCNYSWCVYR